MKVGEEHGPSSPSFLLCFFKDQKNFKLENNRYVLLHIYGLKVDESSVRNADGPSLSPPPQGLKYVAGVVAFYLRSNFG